MPSSSTVKLLLSIYSSAVYVCLLLSPALAFELDHKYRADEQVTIWANKIGPCYDGFHSNPQERYDYYSLPFCRPSKNSSVHKWGGLGWIFGENELVNSQINIKFLRNVHRSVICRLKLDKAKVKHFKNAIENEFWFEFFMDDLPLWGVVGDVPSEYTGNKHILYTHKKIVVEYNNDQIIHVKLFLSLPRPLEVGRTVAFTYSVRWIPTNVTFDHRFDVYSIYLTGKLINSRN